MATRPGSGKTGAMLISAQTRLYAIVILVGLAAAATLWISGAGVAELALWVRIAVPMLLFTGISGVKAKKSILITFSWLGIFLFFVSTILVSFPTEDDVLGWADETTRVAPQEGVASLIYIRILICALVSVVWWWSFRKLIKAAKE